MVLGSNILDLVMQLHGIARQLETDNKYKALGSELRNFADRLNRVYKHNIDVDNLDPVERDYLEYLSTLGQ